MERLFEYANHHPWLAGALVLVSILVIVYEMRVQSEAKASVSPQDMVRLMNQGALLIDLRPLEQYSAGHVGGARQMRFLADPIGGSNRPVSDDISVLPGDHVSLVIPPSASP